MKAYESLKSKLFFKGILRTLLETYLKLAITTFSALQFVDLTGEQPIIIKSSLTLALFFGVIIGYPLFACLFLKSKAKVL